MAGQFDVLYVGTDAEERVTGLESAAPLSVTSVPDADAVLETLTDVEPDCIVSEQTLVGTSGLEVLHRVRNVAPRIPFMLVVDEGSESLASDAIHAGVSEYLSRTGDDSLDAERVAEAVHRAASRYRAEQDVAMLNDLARNVYERVTDAFFAVDRGWRFTYLNEHAADILDLEAGAVVGENLWEVFPDAVGTTYYAESHRAMATQEPVTFTEYFTPTDETLHIRAFPSEDGLSVHFRPVTDDESAEDGDHLAELTSLLSHDLIDSIEDVRRDVERARENCTCDTDDLESAADALDRMADLVNHSMRLANEP